jgi:hypothetical protein
MALVVVDSAVVDTKEEGSQRNAPSQTMQADQILAVDGQQVSRCDSTMIRLPPGCHLISAVYHLTWPQSAARGALRTSTGTVEGPAPRGLAPDFGTTKVLFAVPMTAGRTYQVSVRPVGKPHPRIEEIDAAGATLRVYYPVDFATRACKKIGSAASPPSIPSAAHPRPVP